MAAPSDVFRKLDSAQRGASEERARRLADRGLTAREVEIVQHVCQGRTNAEIAEALDLAAATIGPLLTRIYKRLGVKGRHELMAKASRRHWD